MVTQNLTDINKYYSHYLKEHMSIIRDLANNDEVELNYLKKEVQSIVKLASTKVTAYWRFVNNIKYAKSKKQIMFYCNRAVRLGSEIPEEPATV